jgi:hypothetical protein
LEVSGLGRNAEDFDVTARRYFEESNLMKKRLLDEWRHETICADWLYQSP